MPESSVDGVVFETSREARCPDHGMIGLGPLALVKDLITSHFLDMHPDLTVVTQNVHFTIEVAPVRCDLCGAVTEPQWWTHVTAVPMIEFGDSDGRWAVCDTCHEAVVTMNVDAFLDQVVRIVAEQTPFIPAEFARANRTSTFVAFVLLADAGVRNSRVG